MLDRDGAERGERGGLLQHSFGHVGLQADAFPLAGAERAGLVEDRVGDAEATEAVHEAGSAKRREIVTRYAERAARFVSEIGDGLAMAEEVRRLQIDEVRDRPQRSLELRVREAHSERGFRGDDCLPGLGRIEAREDVVGRVASAAATVGSNCLPERSVPA